MARHEKIGLMCTKNLTTFLVFNFIDKNSNPIKFSQFMQPFKGNLNILNSEGGMYRKVYFVYISPVFSCSVI